MSEQVSVRPPEQEVRIPEANALEKLNRLFYKLGKVTRRSSIPHQEKSVSRPLWLRGKRAELFHQTQGSDSETSKKEYLC